ncbi:MAG: MFS transporter [Acidimicrobiales bacterium]|nr:MAG: MFS transporter [Acidimicrobiales bacterium]
MSVLRAKFQEAEKLLILCGATFLVMAGQGVVGPVLPLYARDFGVSATMVGLTLTVFALARLILNIPAGLIADRFGRRVLLIGGPILTSIGMFGSGFAGDIWSLLIWRFVAGAGSAFFMSGALIYLIDIAPPDLRARYVATNQWALSVGVALGPGLGGLVAERWGLAAPFHLVGVIALFAAVYAVFRLPETRRSSSPELKDESPAREAARIARSGPFLAIAFVTGTIFMTRAGTRATLVPLHADETLAWGPGELGLVFTVTGVMTLFTLWPATWATENIGRASVILFSAMTAALGTFVIGSSSTPMWFVLGNLILTLGTGTAGPAPAAFVADLFPERMRGLGVGLYRSAGDVGFVLGPPALGWLSDNASMSVAFQTAGCLVGAAGVYFVLVTRRSESHVAQETGQ